MPLFTSDSRTACSTSRVISTNCVRRFVLTRRVFIAVATLWDGDDEVGTNVFNTGVPFDFFKALLTPAHGKGEKTQFAGLQRFVRVQKVRQELLVCGEHVLLVVQRAADFLLQLLSLVGDFLLRGLDRVFQARIE